MTGQTISHYRVLEKLGEGGMGVVYKAEDTKLRRTVALKFLPPHALENRERFLREAQAAAALNHPNICTVFEIDEEHGFLAMELIDGVSVKDKIAARPLPLDEALDVAMQTCAGLQAAHEKGIVHRDIKSANLMLTSQGQVKIMDFGLAQVGGRTRITKMGSSLGTPAYMSPEQAQGEALDRRTDVWSLGVVLYEMLAGRLPFRGDTEQAVTYGIVHSEPEPLTAIRTGLLVELDRVVAKALAKDPSGRYQHIEDLLVDLRAMRGRISATRPPVPTPATRRVLPWLGWLAAAAIAALFVASRFLSQPVPARRIQFVLEATADHSAPQFARFSPNGRRIAFAAQDSTRVRKLWVRSLDDRAARPLAGTDGVQLAPFWSPDGNSIGFGGGGFGGSGKLKRVSLSDATVLTICDGVQAAWSPDGEILFVPGPRTPLSRVRASGGQPAAVTELNRQLGENSHRGPRFLPDGRHFLFTARTTSLEQTAIYVGSLDTKKVRRLVTAQSPGVYAPPGFLLFVREGALMAQRFDASTLQLKGDPIAVAAGLFHDRIGALADFDVSADGALLTFRVGGAPLLQLTWFDRSGKLLSLAGAPGLFTGPRLSPDGSSIAVSMPDLKVGNWDLWLAGPDGARTRLNLNPANDWIPVWSPDGRRILFSSDRQGGEAGIWQQIASAGAPDEFVFGPSRAPTDLSHDGRFLAFETSGKNPDVAILPIPPTSSGAPKAQPVLVASTEFDESDGHFSPDGRWIAYTSNESGQFQVYLKPMPAQGPNGLSSPAERWQVSRTGGAMPRWARDTGELFFKGPGGMLMTVSFRGQIRPEAAVPQPLFRTCTPNLPGGYWTSNYDVAGDGRRFLFNCPAPEESPSSTIVEWNWLDRIQTAGAK